MKHQSWFVLPPDQAFYYQQSHPDYKPLPGWRRDCLDQVVENQDNPAKKRQDNPISLVYPRANTQIYIPTELTGKQGKTLFKAIHRKPDTQIFWHLDNQFLGATKKFHEQAIYASVGKHHLTLVDEDGNTVKQSFKVLNQ
jgi:penicillin-binding protein 1C